MKTWLREIAPSARGSQDAGPRILVVTIWLSAAAIWLLFRPNGQMQYYFENSASITGPSSRLSFSHTNSFFAEAIISITTNGITMTCAIKVGVETHALAPMILADLAAWWKGFLPGAIESNG